MEFSGDHFSCFVVWFVDTFFFREKGYFFNKLLGCTLIFAREVCMTDFEHCVIDGSYKKKLIIQNIMLFIKKMLKLYLNVIRTYIFPKKNYLNLKDLL